MKNPDEDLLLTELLTGPEVANIRETSLSDGLRVMAQTRRRRAIIRATGLAVLPALALCLVLLGQHARQSERNNPMPSTAALSSAPEMPSASSVEYISDNELLALFPDQPLALVGPEGRQQLIFLDRAIANDANTAPDASAGTRL